jgi:hypothetical protein
MEKISKRGGVRPNSGRKPQIEKKHPITIYIEEADIEKNGGKDELKKKIAIAVKGDFISDRNNPLVNAARGRDEDGGNKDEIDIPKKKKNKSGKGSSSAKGEPSSDNKNGNNSFTDYRRKKLGF